MMLDLTRFGAAQSPTAQQLLHTTACHPTSDVCIVTAIGEIDLFTTSLLEAVLWAELAADPAHLIVDLGGVRFLAARGVRCLLQARDIAARSGRTRLHLAGLHNQYVDRPLQLTATIELFDTHLTLGGAVAVIATESDSTSHP